MNTFVTCVMRTWISSLYRSFVHIKVICIFHNRHTQHLIPKELNSPWKKRHVFNYRDQDVEKFLLLYGEKHFMAKKRQKIRDRNHVMGLLKRFPNMDMEALKAQYPDVDIEKCKQRKKARGHYSPS